MLSAYLFLSLLHTDLTPELPSIEEATRLPPLPAIRMAQAANEAYQAELRRIKVMAPPWEEENIDAAMGETIRLRQVWDLIDRAADSRTGCWNMWERRDALRQVREMIGATAWVSEAWPHPIPIWRLPPLDR